MPTKQKRYELIAKWDPCEAFPCGYSGSMEIVGTRQQLEERMKVIGEAKFAHTLNLVAFPDVMWIVEAEDVIHSKESR